MSRDVHIIRGRLIGEREIREVVKLIEMHPNANRTHLSQTLCDQWNWRRPDGTHKEVAARELLLRLERMGHVTLPPRQNEGSNHKRGFKWLLHEQVELPLWFSQEPLSGTVGQWGKVDLLLMRTRKEQKMWNHLIHRYHYLGYHNLVGPSLKYIIRLKERWVGCIGFASAVWKLGIRDQWIGWGSSGQQSGLSAIVNNVRFLLFPWVHIKYLASRVLSVAADYVRKDWQAIYNTPALLLETFVEKERFRGTCYKAANWIYIGETKGQTKRGLTFRTHGKIKDVYLYPLVPDCRERLRVTIQVPDPDFLPF